MSRGGKSFNAEEATLVRILDGMENEDDFTFCPVGVSTDQNCPEIKKLAADMDGITVKGDSSGSSDRDLNSVFPWRGKLQNSSISKKEAAVGSLTFNVIDTSSPRQPCTQVAPRDAGTSVKKPAPRTKVPFEKGYSQMEWLKLTRTHPDLAGVKGLSNSRLISMSEVRQHQTEGSMWTVLKGRVYSICPYMKFHPGGVDMLMKAVGKDCTSLFSKYHAWVNAEFLLEKCLVGTLDESEGRK